MSKCYSEYTALKFCNPGRVEVGGGGGEQVS